MQIRFATVADTDALMAYIDQNWRQGHILSRDRELFLHDFREADRLNLAIAVDAEARITGLFGFMKYSRDPLPDIAGSLWKAEASSGVPMLGLKLRDFVIQNVPHRLFAAPGAGIQTQPIYHLLGMQWVEMEHYYLINPNLDDFKIASVPQGFRHSPVSSEGSRDAGRVYRVVEPRVLETFEFDCHKDKYPFKDLRYVEKRFFSHPVYEYEVYALEKHGMVCAVLVARVAYVETASVLRIVDYYGEDAHLPALVSHLREVAWQRGHEYMDFVCYGFNPAALARCGFSKLDMRNDELIIPNHMEPLVRKNVPVYCVADRSATLRLRLCKADGDQDRPNQLRFARERASSRDTLESV